MNRVTPVLCALLCLVLAALGLADRASACSDMLVLSNIGASGDDGFEAPLPPLAFVQYEGADPSHGMARVRLLRTAAPAGASCAAAVAVGWPILVESLRVVDEDGNPLDFSEFAFDPRLSHALGGPPGARYWAFRATARSTIPETASELEIRFRVLGRRASRGPDPRVADHFLKGRVATGQTDGQGRFVDHFAIVTPTAAVSCLGPADPASGLTACPPLRPFGER